MATQGDRHPTDMAGLRGARIVTSIETEQGSRWAESKLRRAIGEAAVGRLPDGSVLDLKTQKDGKRVMRWKGK